MKSNFRATLTAFAERGKSLMDQVVRETVFQVGLRAIQLSPVDTGRFQRNWVYGYNDPVITYNANAQGVSGPPTVQHLSQMPSKAARGVHYITNATPYGPVLEAGRVMRMDGVIRGSMQAPAGFVGITVASFRDIVQVAAMKVK